MKWLAVVLVVAALVAGYVVRSRDGVQTAELPAPEPARATAADILSQHSLDPGDRMGARSSRPGPGGINGHLRQKVGGAMDRSVSRSERN
jgi:hypothetical protein